MENEEEEEGRDRKWWGHWMVTGFSPGHWILPGHLIFEGALDYHLIIVGHCIPGENAI